TEVAQSRVGRCGAKVRNGDADRLEGQTCRECPALQVGNPRNVVEGDAQVVAGEGGNLHDPAAVPHVLQLARPDRRILRRSAGRSDPHDGEADESAFHVKPPEKEDPAGHAEALAVVLLGLVTWASSHRWLAGEDAKPFSRRGTTAIESALSSERLTLPLDSMFPRANARLAHKRRGCTGTAAFFYLSGATSFLALPRF